MNQSTKNELDQTLLECKMILHWKESGICDRITKLKNAAKALHDIGESAEKEENEIKELNELINSLEKLSNIIDNYE